MIKIAKIKTRKNKYLAFVLIAVIVVTIALIFSAKIINRNISEKELKAELEKLSDEELDALIEEIKIEEKKALVGQAYTRTMTIGTESYSTSMIKKTALEEAMERLSGGLRIDKDGEDAGGLIDEDIRTEDND